MTTVWTSITKPSVAGWIGVSKPVGTTSVLVNTFSGGIPIGLLLSLTQTSVIATNIITVSNWTSVAGHATPWTLVPKAT